MVNWPREGVRGTATIRAAVLAAAAVTALVASATARPALTAAAVAITPIASVGGEAWSVAIDGSVAYVGGYRDGGARILAYDIGDVERPVLAVASPVLRGVTRRLDVSGGRALLALGSSKGEIVPYWDTDGVISCDVSDPRLPCHGGESTLDAPARVYDVVLDHGTAQGNDAAHQADTALVLRGGRVDVVRVAPDGALTAIGQWAPGVAGRDPQRAALVGEHAFVAAGHHVGPPGVAFTVLDLARPTEPRVLGAVEVPAPRFGSYAPEIGAVVSDGRHVFVVGDGIWLWAIDVSDPGQPRTVAFVDDSAFDLTGAALDAGRLYVVGGLTGGAAADYAPVNGGQVRVFDVSDPTTPRLLAAADVPGAPQDVAVLDDHLLVANGTSGLMVVRVGPAAGPDSPGASLYLPSVSVNASPDAATVPPLVAGARALTVGPTALATNGSAAYVGLGAALAVWDVADPTHPRELGRTDLLPFRIDQVVTPPSGAPPSHVFVLYAGDRKTYSRPAVSPMIGVVDVRDPIRPRLAGRVSLGAHDARPRIATDAAGAFVYATGQGESGLLVVDVRQPERPRIVGHLSVDDWWTNDVAVASAESGSAAGPVTIAWLVGTSQLYPVDVSAPDQPRLAGTPAPLGWSISDARVAVRGKVAHILASDVDVPDVHLLTYDVGSVAPTQMGDLGGLPWPGELVVGDGVAYEVHTRGEVAIDIGDPMHPRRLGERTGGYSSVSAAGLADRATLYRVEPGASIRAVDVADPIHMAEVAEFADSPRVVALAVVADPDGVGNMDDERLLAAAGSEGLYEYAVGDPTSRRHWTLSEPGDQATGVAYTWGYAHIGITNRGGIRGGVALARLDDIEPAVKKTFRVGHNVSDVVAWRTDVYVVEETGVRVLNRDAAMRDVARLGDLQPRRIAKDAAAGLVVAGTRTWFIDADARGTPRHVGLLTPEAHDVAVVWWQAKAYLATAQGLRVIDVRDPAAPREVEGGVAVPVTTVAASADSGVVCAAGRTLVCLFRDLPRDRPVPFLLRSLPDAAVDLAVGRGEVFVATAGSGVLAVPIAQNTEAP